MDPISQKETDRRLAAHLCVWCRTRLDESSPDSTFCCGEHQIAWHRTKNGDTSYTPPSLADELLADSPTREAFGHLADVMIAQMVRQAEANNQYGDLLDTPQDHDHARRDEAEDTTIREFQLRAGRPGELAPPPTESIHGNTHIGLQNVPGLAALVEIDPEPATLPYPHVMISTMAEQGMWRRPTGALRPLRRCQTCGSVGDPSTERFESAYRTVDSVNFATMMAASELDQPLMDVRLARRTVIICPHCRTEYDGVPAVPLITRTPRIDAWTLAVVTARGVFNEHVTGEVIRSVVPGVIDSGVLWRAPYERAQYEAGQYQCTVTGCTDKAQQWMALAAPLTYRGCVWVPTQGVPIRVGMCPMHYYHLQHDLWADQYLMARMPMPMHNDQRIIIH